MENKRLFNTGIQSKYNKLLFVAEKKVILEKLKLDGYYDLNPIFNSPIKVKRDIKNELEKEKSPLKYLFDEKAYPKSTEEFIENLNILDKKISEEKNNLLTKIENCDKSLFYLLYYYNQIFSNIDERKKAVENNIKSNDLMKNYAFKSELGLLYNEEKFEVNSIDSLSKYMKYLEKLMKESENNKKFFYRGHSDIAYRLLPSIFRNENYAKNEMKMFNELLAHSQKDFLTMDSNIEKLFKMQHYGLPTRLLDITTNPLMALYFACESNENKIGEVIIFNVDSDKIKYSKSSQVTRLATLPILNYSKQKDLYEDSKKVCSGKIETSDQLLNIDKINNNNVNDCSEKLAKHLLNHAIILPFLNNERIKNQNGAFLVCGLASNPYLNKSRYSEDGANELEKWRMSNKKNKKVLLLIKNKASIMDSLNKIAINKARVYPEVENVAKYIKDNI